MWFETAHVLTNDGSVDVMIDPTGKVHAFWGLGRVLGAEPRSRINQENWEA